VVHIFLSNFKKYQCEFIIEPVIVHCIDAAHPFICFTKNDRHPKQSSYNLYTEQNSEQSDRIKSYQLTLLQIWTVYMELYVQESAVFIVEFWQKFISQLIQQLTSTNTDENVSPFMSIMRPSI